jgi:hypothetical protein
MSQSAQDFQSLELVLPGFSSSLTHVSLHTEMPTNHLVTIQQAKGAGLLFSQVDDPFSLPDKTFPRTKFIAGM